MKSGREVVQIECDSVWLPRSRRRFDDPRKLRRHLDEVHFLFAKPVEMVGGRSQSFVRRLAQRRLDPRMGILYIEDRIVARSLHHLGKVKVHLGIGLARKHGEPDGVLADFLDHIGDGDEIARPF